MNYEAACRNVVGARVPCIFDVNMKTFYFFVSKQEGHKGA